VQRDGRASFSSLLLNCSANRVNRRVAYYNFVLTHRKRKITPAMAAGLTQELWTIEDRYDAIMN